MFVLLRQTTSPRARSLNYGAWARTAAAGAVAALVVVISALHVAAPRPELDVALQTSTGIFAAIGAGLVATRVRRRRQLDDVLLTHALSVLAITAIVLGTVPAILVEGGSPPFPDAALVGDAIAALLLAMAAFGPARSVAGADARAILALPAAIVVSLAVLALLTGDSHAVAGGVVAAHGRAIVIRPTAVVEAMTGLLLASAAIGFARAFRREGDEFMAWLVPAALLAALARANDSIDPAPLVDWVTTGDVLWLLFLATVAIAGVRDVHIQWRAAAEIAVLEERRRVARDVHDVLAQEIAFLARNLKRLDAGDEVVRRLEAGAGRALVESRQAIASLAGPLDVPLDIELAQAAETVASREGVEVELALARDVQVTPGQRDALIRIASEAIANAARHGAAERVRLELHGDGGIRLRVADTGTGFDPHVWRGEGFGLVSMRERAKAVGARFRLISTPGEGTEVEVMLAPCSHHRPRR